MGKSTRLRLSDLRKVYRIIGDVIEMAHDPKLWRPHLAAELHKLLDLQFSHLYIMPLPLRTGNAQVGQISCYGLDESANKVWLEYGMQGDLSSDPCTPAIERQARRAFTAVRQTLVNNHDWYESGYFNDFRRLTRSDDLIVSLLPMPEIGILHGIGGDRPKGGKPMGRREVICTALIHEELERRWRKLIVQSPGAKRLPPRLAELLGYLRGTESEKEIARKMSLSPFTVHNHVRRLYTTFNVNSRAELISSGNSRQLHDVPRLGVAGL